MKAVEFDFRKSLVFNTDTGITTFGDNRVVIFDATAMGLLRRDLIEEIGPERTRRMLMKFGYKNGFADFIQMKLAQQFDDELELLTSGPVVHTWEGIVHAAPTELRFNRTSGEFWFTGLWKNSYEAEQHRAFYEIESEPVCWTLMGYASGWCTAFFGRPLVAVEPVCVGMGHDHCEWKIQPPEAWGAEALPYIENLRGFWDAKTA